MTDTTPPPRSDLSAFPQETVIVLPDATPPAPSRAPRSRLWKTLLLGILVASLGAGGYLWATVHYDAVAETFTDAVAETRTSQDRLSAQLAEFDSLAAATSGMLAADSGLLTPTVAHTTLEGVLSDATTTVAGLRGLATEPVPALPPKPSLPWELLSGASALDEATQSLRARAVAVHDAADEVVRNGTRAYDALTQSFIPVTLEAVDPFEEQHLSALNSHVIELRSAREHLAELADGGGSDALASAYLALDEAAREVVASHETVLAGKRGPLFTRRLEVEAWARAIAGGVLIDFEWRRIVNGRGADGSAGGTATWNAAHGGYSTITLSNSVAERWPSAVMRALVAHEVGHTISAKCYEMFDWQDRDANEQWATAWALSHGHTADGNGVALYGQPPKSLIDKAASCR